LNISHDGDRLYSAKHPGNNPKFQLVINLMKSGKSRKRELPVLFLTYFIYNEKSRKNFLVTKSSKNVTHQDNW